MLLIQLLLGTATLGWFLLGLFYLLSKQEVPMTTYSFTPSFDDSEIIALTQILESSNHYMAPELLEKLYENNPELTSDYEFGKGDDDEL